MIPTAISLLAATFWLVSSLQVASGACRSSEESVTYELTFHGDWSQTAFPKQYPIYRKNAQWSPVLGKWKKSLNQIVCRHDMGVRKNFIHTGVMSNQICRQEFEITSDLKYSYRLQQWCIHLADIFWVGGGGVVTLNTRLINKTRKGPFTIHTCQQQKFTGINFEMGKSLMRRSYNS